LFSSLATWAQGTAICGSSILLAGLEFGDLLDIPLGA